MAEDLGWLRDPNCILIGCNYCDAAPGEPCDMNGVVGPFHVSRASPWLSMNTLKKAMLKAVHEEVVSHQHEEREA